MMDRLSTSATSLLDLQLLTRHAAGDAALLAQYIARREAGEPVAQILGSKGFWTLDLKVTRDVLCPRPDTETIIEALLKHRPDKARAYRVLDLGTGSGCIVLSVLSEYRQATAVAVDVSEAALAVARENARCFEESRGEEEEKEEEERGEGEKEGRVRFLLGEWCAPLQEGERFDVIVSNPPYIPTGDIAALDRDVREYEPHLALDGGEDGLDCYRVLAKQIPSRMVEGAIALMEVGAGQAQDVAEIMKRSGLAVIDIARDLAGIERVVVLTT